MPGMRNGWLNMAVLRFQDWLGKALSRPSARRRSLLEQINRLEPGLQPLSDMEIRKRSLSLRYRAQRGEPLVRLLPEAYALAREAARRTIGLRHFDVQVLGGIAMFDRSIIEMQTGEGKTLAATLPMYLHSLVGRGCHLATANDYLAQRDAEWMGPLYGALGLSVGSVTAKVARPQRRDAYACDVTYGTIREFAFDFLRDRLLARRLGEKGRDLMGQMLGESHRDDEQPVQRQAHFILVDEADAILLDEARSSLLISAAPTVDEGRQAAAYCFAAELRRALVEGEDYVYDHQARRTELTTEGRHKVRQQPQPASMHALGLVEIYQHVERAIKVAREFHRDRHYVIHHGRVVIVDEHSGRMAGRRHWSGGIHQAVEAKEGLEISPASGPVAQITVQSYLLRYEHLAGMTGTAAAAAHELRATYRCRFAAIPTHRPPVRIGLPEQVFGTADAKWAAVVDEAVALHIQGRPVLIGTRSIDKSQHLSCLLTQRGIEHQVLNAYQVKKEAAIIAQAGRRAVVTVATNMAGRGTDIRLGEGVAALGGLHVILTEMHDSARLDRQLIGRCGRQGDPGSYRKFLALDDELLAIALGPKKARRLAERGKQSGAAPIAGYAGLFRRAQKRVERRHLLQRLALVRSERRRRQLHLRMGQDPYLDVARR